MRKDEDDFKVHPVTLRTFVKQMSLLRYNLYTNTGTTFLGEDDFEKLNRLIEIAKDILLED